MEAFFTSPLFIALASALLTAFVAPAIIESSKKRILRQETVLQKQFEIINNVNKLVSTFLVNVAALRNAYLLKRESSVMTSLIDNYEEFTSTLFVDLRIEIYNTKLYFDKRELYILLRDYYYELSSLDSFVVKLFDASNYGPTDEEKILNDWRETIKDNLKEVGVKSEKVLDALAGEIKK